MWIGSFSYSEQEVSYRWKIKGDSVDWKPIQIDNGVVLSQFDLLGTDWNHSRYIVQNNFLYKFIGMNIGLKRHTGYYLLQVYIPCFMLVILSWVSFYLNREATSDRSCIGIMCVLSLATLSFDVRNDIPNVPYVTALDWFLIMCYLFLFASLLEFTLVHYFTKIGYGDNFVPIDFDSQDEINQEATVSQKYSKKLPNMKRNKNFKENIKMFWKCLTSDSTFKDELKKRAHFKGINSVSKCDKMARVFFPASFIILNLIYWYVFYL